MNEIAQSLMYFSFNTAQSVLSQNALSHSFTIDYMKSVYSTKAIVRFC